MCEQRFSDGRVAHKEGCGGLLIKLNESEIPSGCFISASYNSHNCGELMSVQDSDL
jgi:hypothetical protein